MDTVTFKSHTSAKNSVSTKSVSEKRSSWHESMEFIFLMIFLLGFYLSQNIFRNFFSGNGKQKPLQFFISEKSESRKFCSVRNTTCRHYQPPAICQYRLLQIRVTVLSAGTSLPYSNLQIYTRALTQDRQSHRPGLEKGFPCKCQL